MPTLITRGAVSVRAYGFGAKAGKVIGSQSYTTAGTYTWIAPAGVTKVSVVAVGGGSNNFSHCNSSGGGGGGLGYKNNIGYRDYVFQSGPIPFLSDKLKRREIVELTASFSPRQENGHPV